MTAHYSAPLLDYFFNTHHAGDLSAPAQNIYRARVGQVDNGDVLVMSLACVADKIIQARFLAWGGVALIGGAEFMCRYLEGQTIRQLLSVTPDFLMQSLLLTPVYGHINQLLITAARQLYDSSTS